MFGSSRPPFSGTTSFSGFGTNNNAQQQPAFGSTTGFGRATTFGSQPTAGTGFGAAPTTSTPFGATASTGSSLFGSTAGQANTGGGLFGAPGSSGFGTTAGTATTFNTTANNPQGVGLFGAQNTAAAPSTGLFGAGAAAFGAQQQKPFGFSTPTTGASSGLFSSAAQPTGLFGTNTGVPIPNIVGTTVKYQPVTGTDTMTRNGVTSNIQTRIEVITCMKEYELKSLEELRVEDYLAGRKGPGQGGGIMGGNTFGQPSTAGTTGGLFSTNAQLGAANTGGLFGQKPPENKPLFGTTTNTGFGVVASSSNNAGGGLFSNTAPAFGQAAATSTAQPFNFGQNTQNKGGFSFPSATNNATTGGTLFGQQQQPTTAFGAPNSGFAFGQTATSQPQAVGLFNNQAKPAFGVATATSGGGLFGANKPAGAPAFGGFNTGTATAGIGAFGTTSTASPFGATTNTAAGGLFGNTQAKPVGFGLGVTNTFGNTGTGFNTGTAGVGLFGNTVNTNTGGLFGNTAVNQNKAATGGFSFNTGGTTGFNAAGTNTLGFGLNNNMNVNKPAGFGTMGGGFGNTLGAGGNNMMMGGNTGVGVVGIGDNNIANLIKALTDNPFGHSSLLKTPLTTTGAADELLSPPSVHSKAMTVTCPPTYVLPTSNSQHRVVPSANVASVNNNLLNNRNLLFQGLDDTTESNGGDEIFKTKTFPSVKKLNLKVFNSRSAAASPVNNSLIYSPGVNSPAAHNGGDVRSPLTVAFNAGGVSSPAVNNSLHNDSTTASPDIIKGRGNMKRLNLTYKKPLGSNNNFNDTLADLNVRNNNNKNSSYVVGSPDVNSSAAANFSLYEASSIDKTDAADASETEQPHPCGIKLTRAGYYTIPPLSELSPDDSGRCVVENFSVGREGYGNVCFTSDTDVAGLDLDNTVFIVRKELEVYPDASKKPPVGEALNKTAVITLDAVWPVDKSTRDVIQDHARLEAMGWPRYLEKKCLTMGAKFLEYRPQTGSWVFKVNHFSKYGLQDGNEEEDFAAQQQQGQQNKPPPAYLRKTNDPTLIKSSVNKADTMVAGNNTVVVASSAADNTTAGGDNVTTASSSSTSGGSLSSSAASVNGLGGNSALQLANSSPRMPSNSAPHQQGASAVAASVPDHLFLDSFANEPDEGASLGALAVNKSHINPTLQQLTANMFPMEEDDDDDEGLDNDGAPATTLLGEQSMDMACLPPPHAASVLHRDSSMTQSPTAWRTQPLKKFAAGNRVEALAASEGQQSPAAGSRCQTPTSQEVSSVAMPSPMGPGYRAARTQYPAIIGAGGATDHPVVVAPGHSATRLPYSQSLLHGQHRNIADLAAFQGCSFRVAWGPNWHLVHAGPHLGSQVDVVGAAAAAQKRHTASSATQSTPISYLFMPSGGSSNIAAQRVTHAAADLPQYPLTVEKLHLTDLSAASSKSPDPEAALRCVEACLHQVLHCSAVTKCTNSAPFLEPAPGRRLLHRLASVVQQLDAAAAEADECSTQLSDIAELCMALWGQLDHSWLEAAAGDNAYVEARARVETLSAWVQRVSAANVTGEVARAREDGQRGSQEREESSLDAVMSYLTTRQIYEACSLLQEQGDHHLALLLAQTCMGDDTPRQVVYKQLLNWSECGADATISTGRLALYVLASGRATHHSGAGLINVCKGLDWRRALALHLWYICPATCTISEALRQYEIGACLVEDNDQDCDRPTRQYCQEPLPQYLADHTLPDSASGVSFDICYHLLKLYTQPSHRLDQLLNPATNTPDPLDVSTSWLVMALIRALGYTHVSPVVANGMHLSMAAQLEAAGLWHWAIFVLLSIKHEKSRACEIRAVLSRHVQVAEGIELEDDSFAKLRQQQLETGDDSVTAEGNQLMTAAHNDDPRMDQEDDDGGFVDGEEVEDDSESMDTETNQQQRASRSSQRNNTNNTSRCPQLDLTAEDDYDVNIDEHPDLSTYSQREEFLMTALGVPEKWINECKAVLARSLGMEQEEAWYLIKAGDHKRAHAILVDTIAPSAIINEDHEYLERFITAFEASCPSLGVTVPDWAMGGGVYAHFLHIMRSVHEIKTSQQPTQDKVERLRPRLLALCSQLNSLKTATARHRLCVSEISRVVVGVLRAVLGEDIAATTAIANQVASLPLSRDCALQELNLLTHQYLANIANIE